MRWNLFLFFFLIGVGYSSIFLLMRCQESKGNVSEPSGRVLANIEHEIIFLGSFNWNSSRCLGFSKGKCI